MEVGKSAGRIFSFKRLLLYSKQSTSLYKANALERCRGTYNASPPPQAEDDAWQQDIAVPTNTTSITLKLRAAACSLMNDNSLLCTAKDLPVNYNDALLPAQEIELPLAVEAGNITVVMMTIEYTIVKNGVTQVVKDKRWMPAGMVGAMWN